MIQPFYKITFYVPEAQLEEVKTALFAAGAGKIGNYDQCCWQTCGIGQYRALSGSRPMHPKADEITKVSEYLVEMICEPQHLAAAIKALVATHPYEEPAYAYWEINQRVYDYPQK